MFLISVAVNVNIFEKEPFLSMMIHADREQDASKKFYEWTKMITQNWSGRLLLSSTDPNKIELIEEFSMNYSEATICIILLSCWTDFVKICHICDVRIDPNPAESSLGLGYRMRLKIRFVVWFNHVDFCDFRKIKGAKLRFSINSEMVCL